MGLNGKFNEATKKITLKEGEDVPKGIKISKEFLDEIAIQLEEQSKDIARQIEEDEKNGINDPKKVYRASTYPDFNK